MFARFAAFLLLVWALGFAWFALMLPQPLDGAKTDAIVVLTGGPGRIDRGLEVLQKGWARSMLISGADREVRPIELAVQYDADPKLFDCCIDIGSEAVDTRSNGQETADWVKARDIRSIRLITTDWHMRRAEFELQRALPSEIAVKADAVPSEPSFFMLFLEYHKLLLRWAAAVIGI